MHAEGGIYTPLACMRMHAHAALIQHWYLPEAPEGFYQQQCQGLISNYPFGFFRPAPPQSPPDQGLIPCLPHLYLS
jgi:hypothetical protein